jgi:DNA-binding protein HU-beta
VNKTELIEHIAKHADISKAAATRALESTIGAVKTTLKKGRLGISGRFWYFCGGQARCTCGSQPPYRRCD